MAKADLTAQRLRELLHYDPETGVFTRKAFRQGHFVGSLAGSKNKRGYIIIRIDDASHYAHRLAWLFVTGEWPKQTIDHVNRNKSDNRLKNLRDVSQKINNQNVIDPNAGTVSGFRGVYLDKTRPNPTWMALIRNNGRQQFLGRFKTPEKASEAYLKAKAKLHGYLPDETANLAES